MTSKIDEFGNLVVGTITERGYLYYGLITELGNCVDSITHQISFSDSVAFSESKTNEINKPIVDSASLSENRVVNIERDIVDSIDFVDTKYNNISHKIDDSVSLSDSKNTDINRSLEDSLTLDDEVYNGVTRNFIEQITATDSRNPFSISKIFSDKISIFDETFLDEFGNKLLNFVVTKPFVDSTFLSENRSIDIERNITDNLNIIDDETKSVSHEIDESILISDSKNITGQKTLLSESIEISDSNKNSAIHTLNDELEVDDTIISRKIYKVISDLIETTDVILEAALSLRISNAYTSAQKVKRYTTAIPIVKKAIAYLPDWGQER